MQTIFFFAVAGVMEVVAVIFIFLVRNYKEHEHIGDSVQDGTSSVDEEEERLQVPEARGRRLGLRPKPRGGFAARMLLGAPPQTPLGAAAPRTPS